MAVRLLSLSHSPVPSLILAFGYSYLVAYAGLIVLVMITDVVAHYMHVWGTLQASAVIHRKLIDALLGTTLLCVR